MQTSLTLSHLILVSGSRSSTLKSISGAISNHFGWSNKTRYSYNLQNLSTGEYRRLSGGEVGNDISKSRIETLTDGVFAIVMTLLVLEIAVPQLSHSEAAIELPKQLLELWPVILRYGTSFIILDFFWIGHDYQFHYVKWANRTLLWITIFYLMFVAFVPFSTSLIGEYGDQQISVIIYGINISIVGFWQYDDGGMLQKIIV